MDKNQIVSKLRSLLNFDLVEEVGSFLGEGISILLKNGYNFIIVPEKGLSDRTTYFNKLMYIVHDESFEVVSKILNKEKIKIDHENGSKQINDFLEAFSKNESLTLEDRKELYKGMYQLYPKELYASHYNLGEDPNRELFIFGNDELSVRYHRSKGVKVPPQGLKVRILDESALLFTLDNGKRSIDLKTVGYLDGQYHYPNNQILRYEECPEEEADITVYKNHVPHYQKEFLREDVDLSKERRIPYVKANGMEFILKEDKKKMEYFFEDNNGKIRIGHPDLCVYILDDFEMVD